MRTEGAYTYFCNHCGTFFAVVSRFTVTGDYSESLSCPKCGKNAAIYGEGYINHESYDSVKTASIVKSIEEQENIYPYLLRADHIAEIMNVSKRVAYEIMEHKEFPLIRVGRMKRVDKESFFKWLNKQKNRKFFSENA